jgi:aminopeptidase YwaD
VTSPPPRRGARVAVGALLLAVAAGACTGVTAQDRPSTETAPTTSAPSTAGIAGSPDTAPPADTTPGPTGTDTFPAPILTPATVRGGFSGVRAQAVAVALVDGVGVRVSGTEGDRAARAQVAELLRQAGWDVAEDPFDLPQGGTTANVIATLGAPPAPDDPHVVVGGHIDTRPDTPGANDNASGIGVLVALAEELADEAADLPLPVVLIAFGAEEYQPGTREHHLGSERYAGTHPGVVAMLAVDMVGNGLTTRIVGLEGHDDRLVRRLADVAATAGLTDVVTDARGDISDHGPFALRGIPAAFLWTGPDDRYHSPADTSEHLDLADLQRAGDLALAFLRSLHPDDRDGLQPGVPATG